MINDHYRDRVSRIDALAAPEDRDFWTRLIRLSDEWTGEKNAVWGTPHRWDHFNDWLEVEHGFRIQLDEGGGISPDPDIRDPQKYTVFLLKYSG